MCGSHRTENGFENHTKEDILTEYTAWLAWTKGMKLLLCLCYTNLFSTLPATGRTKSTRLKIQKSRHQKVGRSKYFTIDSLRVSPFRFFFHALLRYTVHVLLSALVAQPLRLQSKCICNITPIDYSPNVICNITRSITTGVCL